MDILRSVIGSLDSDERKEFLVFTQRQRQKPGRKDLSLFHLLDQEEVRPPREIARELYATENLNAYHTLRKRLTRQLTDYFMLKSMDVDSTSYSAVLGMLAISRHMLTKNRPDIATHFLSKAENIARENDVVDLLDNIYNLQIMHAHELGLDVNELIKKWENFRIVAETEERVNMAYGLIRQELNEIKKSGNPRDLSEVMTSAFSQLGIDSETLDRPSLMFKVVSMTRSTVIATKNYYLFESYVTEIYHRLKSQDAFIKKDHYFKFSFLYMITHALYRNRKFDLARDYLAEMQSAMEAFNGSFKNRFNPRYVLLKAAVLSYSGNNHDAIELLSSTLTASSSNLNKGDWLNMILNLAVYRFQAMDFRAANRELLKIQHTDHWCEKKMGKEWRFKKNLIEIIIHVELENSEIALNRIRSIESYFTGFFENELYRRARIFMGFVKTFIEKPEVIHTAEFAEKVDQTIVRLPGDQEDIQAMTFYCWLKSKMVRKDYYEVLIETISTFGKSNE
jgi:hypothetical protein